MSDFNTQMGGPDPAAPDGIESQIKNETIHDMWKDVIEYTGAGWYKNRFLYLFGEGLKPLEACLDAWSFLVPKHRDRMIIGRSAYGAIFCLENYNTQMGKDQRVCVLDPLRLEYLTDENLDLNRLLNHWLPKRMQWMKEILDTSIYDQVVKSTKQFLDVEEILAFKKPAPLGGKLEAKNLQLANIVEYYQSTAPVYKKALTRAK